MDPERWNKVEALYYSALGRAVDERVDWLSRVCDGDDGIRSEVLSLLESADSEDSFLEEPALSFGLSVIGLESEIPIGSRVGRYGIVRQLGRGGMGEVYLAQDPRLDRLVALKVLPASITDDPERVRRFEREARVASAISHPNVAHIYEIGEANGRHFIAMEYVRGPTLRQLLRQRSLTPKQSIEIGIQVATALSAAHRARVIHRDIKPENIILADDGYVKVLDFGLAKLIDGPASAGSNDSQTLSSIHTGPELFMGTSHYMSPEQVRRHPVDLRTDLWSLGVVMCEMLTLHRPFQGQSFSEVIVAIIETAPQLESENQPLAQPARVFLRKALEKRAGDRYQTADELLTDLRRLHLDLANTLSEPSGARYHESFASPLNSSKTQRDIFTKADPIRTQTVGQRLDTVAHEGKLGGSIMAKPSKRSLLTIIGFTVVLATAGYVGLVRNHPRKLANQEVNLRFERLNLSGNIDDMILSPDGKYVAYAVLEGGRQTIHVTELATSSDIRVAAPSEKGYTGLSFSPDGTYLYYLENQVEAGELYRVSKLGGGVRKILNNVSSPVSFSPNGEEMAFVRTNDSPEPGQLIIARADGSGDRVLVKRTSADTDFFLSDTRSAGPVWSPDGKLLACPTRSTAKGHIENNIEIIDVASGRWRKLNILPWADIARIAWLADGSGLIVAAKEKPSLSGQLHLLSYPDGISRKITSDPNNYSLISAARDSSLFLALNVEDNASVWEVSPTKASTLSVTERKGISQVNWSSNAGVLYSIHDGAHMNIWFGNTGLADARQLTFESDNASPGSSPDGKYVVFASMRSGTKNIWRVNSDGTQPARLTTGKYEDMPSITPNGKWVIYRTGKDIRKVSIEGGNPIKLFDKITVRPALSPDGRLLALFAADQSDEKKWRIEVFDLAIATSVKSFSLPDATDPFNDLRWTSDGQALAYVSKANGSDNVWLQPLRGGVPSQVTDFKDAGILSFAWSPKGNRIICVRNTKAYIAVLVKLF